MFLHANRPRLKYVKRSRRVNEEEKKHKPNTTRVRETDVKRFTVAVLYGHAYRCVAMDIHATA